MSYFGSLARSAVQGLSNFIPKTGFGFIDNAIKSGVTSLADKGIDTLGSFLSNKIQNVVNRFSGGSPLGAGLVDAATNILGRVKQPSQGNYLGDVKQATRNVDSSRSPSWNLNSAISQLSTMGNSLIDSNPLSIYMRPQGQSLSSQLNYVPPPVSSSYGGGFNSVVPDYGYNSQYSRGNTPLSLQYGMSSFGSSNGLRTPQMPISGGNWDSTGFGQQTNYAQLPNQPMVFTPQAFASMNQQYVAPGGRTLNPPPTDYSRPPGSYTASDLTADF